MVTDAIVFNKIKHYQLYAMKKIVILTNTELLNNWSIEIIACRLKQYIKSI